MSRQRGARGKPFSHHQKAKEECESGNTVSKKLLLNAARTGTLNLQNREMTQIPDDVYKLNDPELFKTLGAGEDVKWWETEPINKLYLCSNKISLITPDIQQLSSLTLLDLRDNCLESVPDELASLSHLTRLELSHNKLSSLPPGLGPNLTHLSLNNNLFNEVPSSITEMQSLLSLDIRENSVKVLPCPLPSSLESLAVDENKLTSLVCENMAHVINISASGNVLTHVRLGNLPNLKTLSVRVNKLEFIEPIVNCNSLQELYLGKNFLSQIGFVNTLPGLIVLDCSDNKIAMVPDEITRMTRLKRLDLSNNDLNTLPPQLGNMEQLDSLVVEGNPLRTIRREIISKGTEAVKDYLRMKLAPPEDDSPVIPDVVVDEKMMKSKNMELDKLSLSQIDASLWDQALACGITRLSMKSSGHAAIPDPVFSLRITLQELDLSCNALSVLPPEIGKLSKLRKLNLLKNNIRDLPEEVSELKCLEDLNMSQNKLSAIPDSLLCLTSLQSLILSNNQISKLEPAKLMGMTSLSHLDLENNNIGRLPPEICLLPSIRNLLVMGNTFKIPRADVLSRGSSEVLAWLKNKVPQ